MVFIRMGYGYVLFKQCKALSKILPMLFSSDDDYLRMQRLQAAANAQQTAKLYEANKIQKYTSTGLQIGSILLMILALIL